MSRDYIIRMALKCGAMIKSDCDGNGVFGDGIDLLQFAALVAAAEREKVAAWMIKRSYATGHGDTTEDLLAELDWQIAENWNRAMINGIETEREACAKVCEQRAADHEEDSKWEDDPDYKERFLVYAKHERRCAAEIRARGK